ncbi:MAG: hypothetical protein HJJLKODD_00388 [Phycisphaerae bacterium]|nr:hypothetical protein [Phycisphaerae bacterium]
MLNCAADLHIHTALSPCADDTMTPPNIVQRAVESGLKVIAICDHNSTVNTVAVQQAAGSALLVLIGMEITTAEEIHVLGYFPDASAARRVAIEVQATLPAVTTQMLERFGHQWIMDADGQILGEESRMLAAATQLTLSETVQLIHQHQGIAVAAHVNRPSFSVISQLGIFPQQSGLDAIEIFTRRIQPADLKMIMAIGLPVWGASDSHFPDDIGSIRTRLAVEDTTFDEWCLAVKRQQGRSIGDA